jgi:hypothetical protein
VDTQHLPFAERVNYAHIKEQAVSRNCHGWWMMPKVGRRGLGHEASWLAQLPVEGRDSAVRRLAEL